MEVKIKLRFFCFIKTNLFPIHKLLFLIKLENETTISKIRTNNDGKATIALEKKGAFLISAVHFKKSEIKNADWHSLWASLTFKK